MTSFFDTCPDRRQSDSFKWDKYGDDILPLWVADMDFCIPEPVQQALEARVAHGIYGYSTPSDSLKEAVVSWVAARYHWDIDPDWLAFVPGVVTGMNLVARGFAGPGDGIVVRTPLYHRMLEVHDNFGMESHESELIRTPSGRYEIDFDAFEQSIRPNSRVFLLCNPHNPTGRAFTRRELERTAEICLRHNVLICADEIHADLLLGGSKHISIAALDPEIAQNSITFISTSKTFNLAGLKTSVAIAPNKEIREQFVLSCRGVSSNPNNFGLTAMEAAYRRGLPWLEEMLAYLETNLDLLDTFVTEELPGISMARPEATFLAWLDCRALALPASPADYFREHARVALNDGGAFGAGGEGFVRLNFACPRTTLEEALHRMKAALPQPTDRTL